MVRGTRVWAESAAAAPFPAEIGRCCACGSGKGTLASQGSVARNLGLRPWKGSARVPVPPLAGSRAGGPYLAREATMWLGLSGDENGWGWGWPEREEVEPPLRRQLLPIAHAGDMRRSRCPKLTQVQLSLLPI
jgi:hypothetical protein